MKVLAVCLPASLNNVPGVGPEEPVPSMRRQLEVVGEEALPHVSVAVTPVASLRAEPHRGPDLRAAHRPPLLVALLQVRQLPLEHGLQHGELTAGGRRPVQVGVARVAVVGVVTQRLVDCARFLLAQLAVFGVLTQGGVEVRQRHPVLLPEALLILVVVLVVRQGLQVLQQLGLVDDVAREILLRVGLVAPVDPGGGHEVQEGAPAVHQHGQELQQQHHGEDGEEDERQRLVLLHDVERLQRVLHRLQLQRDHAPEEVHHHVDEDHVVADDGQVLGDLHVRTKE